MAEHASGTGEQAKPERTKARASEQAKAARKQARAQRRRSPAAAVADLTGEDRSPPGPIESRLARIEEAVATQSRRNKELVRKVEAWAQAAIERDGESPPPIVAFVHIPKTAGGTVTSMFVGAYARHAVRNVGNYPRGPESAVEKLRRPRGVGEKLKVGHVPYGLFREHLAGMPCRYITFLREPVDRVLSHYYRHRAKNPRNRTRGELATAGGKITAASIEEALPLPQLSNLATRFLCGHPSPMGELPASAVDDAKENLREFAFVGIQERFEESIILLRRLLELPPARYENQHVSSDRPSVEEIPDQQRKLIEEHNQLDIELYRFALGLFEESIPTSDAEFVAEVEALRGGGSASG